MTQTSNPYRKILADLDTLVKSRFIEMFGDCKKAPLTEMADITMGQSPDSSTYNDQGIGVPFFQGKTEFTDTFVKVNKYCSKPKKMAKEMDILMSVRAPVGSVNLTSQMCCIGRGLAAITPKKGITDVWFLFNALKTMEQQISDMGVGSTFTAINKDDMKKIMIPVASMDIQNQFSEFVKQVDKSKVIVKQLIEKYDMLVKSRFIEMFGDINCNTGKYPLKSIGEFAKCVAGATPSTVVKDYWENGSIPWMSSGEVNQGRIYNTEKKITQKGYDNCSTNMIPAHTVVIALAGQGKTRGTVAIAEIELCTNQSICSIITNDKMNTDYLHYALKVQYDQIRRMSNGDGGRGGLNLKIVEKIKVICPPREQIPRFFQKWKDG